MTADFYLAEAKRMIAIGRSTTNMIARKKFQANGVAIYLISRRLRTK